MATLRPVLLLAAILCLSGCARYQLGSPVDLPFKTVYLRPASDSSYAPQAQALLSSALRQTFIRDGRVTVLANAADADAVLEIDIDTYERRAGARQTDDTTLATDFDLIMGAVVDLYDNNAGRSLISDREVRARTTAFVRNPYAAPGALQTSAYNQSEFEAMPRLARDLARRIADEVLSPWPEKE